jgi:signal transduction histidine kinase
VSARLTAFLCYALIAVIFAADALTPQLFVVAILLNGPIALSGVALRPRLTVALVVLAQICNVVAAYINSAQAGQQWQPIAIGDRALTAASFVLVGYLTVRAADLARRSGVVRERERRAELEVRLRRALDGVQAYLNVQLVIRAIVREVVPLLRAKVATLIVRTSTMLPPEIYSLRRDGDVGIERRALDPHTASIVQRVLDQANAVAFDVADPVARTLIEASETSALLAAPIRDDAAQVVLLVFSERSGDAVRSLFQAYCDGVAPALAQARLFERLGTQNQEIARQNEALDERGRVIRDIVYALAHDLRTPLAAARVTMQQALEGAYGPLPAAYREIVKTSIASNEDVRNLVDTLLMVARYESGEASSVREPVELGAQIERVGEELHALAESNGVALRTAVDGRRAVVVGDPLELRRAISNLAANAITATPKGGEVEITLGADDGNAVVRVDDTGYGVAPELRERLFERFARNEGAMGSGTGLGLYIVRRIAESHGGKASYEPRERGSRFTLTLPRAT